MTALSVDPRAEDVVRRVLSVGWETANRRGRADRTQSGERNRGAILLDVRGPVAALVVAGAPQRLCDRTRSGRLEEPRVPRAQPWRCGERVHVRRRNRAHTRGAFPATPGGNTVRTLRPHPWPETEARSRGRVLVSAVPDCRLHGAETRRLFACTGVRGVAELTQKPLAQLHPVRLR